MAKQRMCLGCNQSEKPDGWEPFWLAIIILVSMLAAVLYMGLPPKLKAAPITDVASIEGRGNHGMVELRDPVGRTENIYYLIRACLRCHSQASNAAMLPYEPDGTPKQPYTLIFDKAKVMYNPAQRREYLRRYINLGLDPTGTYGARTAQERFDLRRAAEWLSR